MKQISKYCGFLSFLAFCLGSAFLLLMPLTVFLWGGLFLLTLLLLLVLAALEHELVVYYFFHRNTKYGMNLALIVLLGLGIIASLNYLGANYRKRFDLTHAQRLTLSEQTQKVIRELPYPVKIIYFSQVSNEIIAAQTLVGMYQNASPKLRVENYPLLANPGMAKSLGVQGVQTGEQVFVIQKIVGAGEDPGKPLIVKGATEEKITGGLIRLLKTQNQTVYFLSGHGERTFTEKNPAESLGELKRLIEGEVFTVKGFSFDAAAKIPEDATVLVIAGPVSEFQPSEMAELKHWVEAGGKLLLCFDIDIKHEDLPKGAQQLAAWLAGEYGVHVGNKLLLDATSKLFQIDRQIIVATADSTTHEISKDFPRTGVAMGFIGQFFVPFTVRLTPGEKQPPNVELAPILKTSPAAWEETSWQQVKTNTTKYDKGQDFQGSMALGYAIEGKSKDSWRIVALGSSGLLTNGLIQANRNKDLVLNSINWLANQEGVISIRPKETKDYSIDIDGRLYNFIALILMVVMPISILGTGIWRWFQHKAR